MKSFKEYLMEGDSKQYDYRIKIAGELTPEVVAEIKNRLDKYDVVSISDPKKTPIQKSPTGFPGIHNQEINIIDFVFRYPAASLDEIRQQVFQAGVPLNNVMVMSSSWDDSMNDEISRTEEIADISSTDSLLNTFDLPKPTPEQKQLSKEYSEDNLAMVKRSVNKPTFTVAGSDHTIGGEPQSSYGKTTNSLPMGNESPLTKGNRIPKPTVKSSIR